MNDNTNEQPQGSEVSPLAASASQSSQKADARRNDRPGKASLADAAGADALMALARQMRQARGEPEPVEEQAPEAEGKVFSKPDQRGAKSARPEGQVQRRSNRPGSSSRAQTGQGRSTKRYGAPAEAAAPVRTPRPLHPVLVQLAQLYPHLFGEQPVPLKRGIFQDLVAAHPVDLDAAGLKVALGLHTRSYRYLNGVSQGLPRHDLSGVVVEAMAPEHVHHALLEVFRRRKPRDGEDMALKLRRRIAIAFEASGLTRESYDQLVRGRNQEANAALDDALIDVAERDAKAEALRRAYEASGKDEVSFAEMYGVRPQAVHQALKRCEQMSKRVSRENIPEPKETTEMQDASVATPAQSAAATE